MSMSLDISLTFSLLALVAVADTVLVAVRGSISTAVAEIGEDRGMTLCFE